ncbi:Abi family protein [Arthrobacter sp. HLT1-20]
MDNSKIWELAERNFSQARLSQYVVEASGNAELAMALYAWKTDVSSAFWGSLGHLEVALRNAIDRQMSIRQGKLGRGSHWIFDEASELGRGRGRRGRKHGHPYADIAIAIERVRHNNKLVVPDQIISEISFGFWHQMVSKNQMFLWPDLASAFPYAPARNQRLISDKVKSMRTLRNRIGHHHRIWEGDIPLRYDELIRLAGFIDPELGSWIDVDSKVPEVLRRHPRTQLAGGS